MWHVSRMQACGADRGTLHYSMIDCGHTHLFHEKRPNLNVNNRKKKQIVEKLQIIQSTCVFYYKLVILWLIKFSINQFISLRSAFANNVWWDSSPAVYILQRRCFELLCTATCCSPMKQIPIFAVPTDAIDRILMQWSHHNTWLLATILHHPPSTQC